MADFVIRGIPDELHLRIRQRVLTEGKKSIGELALPYLEFMASGGALPPAHATNCTCGVCKLKKAGK